MIGESVGRVGRLHGDMAAQDHHAKKYFLFCASA